MGRPPGRLQSRPFQMRTSDEFIRSIDKWRAKQDDKPPRAEAIRRLVEIGLATAAPAKPTNRQAAARASKLAAQMIDILGDGNAPTDEREKRKRRLLKGPSEFRYMRADLLKSKPGS
jgi:hypothetical protein